MYGSIGGGIVLHEEVAKVRERVANGRELPIQDTDHARLGGVKNLGKDMRIMKVQCINVQIMF